jgi:RNA polymerase sigma factor (sigma-70 family)
MPVQLVSSWEHDLRARLIAREPQALTDVYDHFVRSVFGLAARVTSGGVEEAVESVIVSERARVALAALPAEQRRTIELAYLKGLTYREVAERLGIPEGTAKSRIRLGLGRMAQRLRDGVCDRQLT